ncbi:MAG TPA: GTP-binding protein [Candidatus Poseidoniales archaeon]|jgi:translation initiation factor 5B|nr:MAG TPA: GTP-binding protein [Candidatus Poseidoniales archaeon]HII22405.1 GTP-binding protein [Candidatus Poseidoniaceae archaeon]|tara:strand:- start:1598 stop:3520 length:1923 start_codon:yes stop_codon:yes gene_type:complete
MDETETDSPEETVTERGHNRQPIVSVLGHVDHGKTSVLDLVRSIGSERQASVMDREAGGITQHIGATEVPADVLNETCAAMMGGKKFKSPGLLFIDTPGHHSFVSLRNRGGSVADIAVLVIDVMEGLQPQTIESLQTLKETRTPFVIACNKVDRIHGWRTKHGRSFMESFKDQREDVRSLFEDRYWKLLGQFSEHGFNIERYDQIRDFRQNVALVPMSAKDGEGLQDLLAVTVGLAERFLEDRLTDTLGAAEGTVLEMRDEVGMGKTIDVILYRGELKIGDKVMLAANDGPFSTHIKGLKRPKGMSEMRDAGKRWVNFDSVEAACGVKIVAPKLENTIAGTTLYLANTPEQKEQAEAAIRQEWRAIFDTMPIMCSKCNEVFPRIDFKAHTKQGVCRGAEEERKGVVIKADTVGGLEALGFELAKLKIPVRQATVGPVNKRDILMAKSAQDPLNKVILGFSVKGNSEVADSLSEDDSEIKFFSGSIIYHILDAYEAWREETAERMAAELRESLVYPGRLLYLKDHTFRAKGPAIVGMRVVGGRVHIGQRLMKLDGTPVGQIKSLRTRASEDVKEANQGDEVAVAINGPTVGRHIEELDEFYVDVPESHAKRLKKIDLNPVEQEILDELIRLHRKENHFWGR